MPAKMQVMLTVPVTLGPRTAMKSLMRGKITKAEYMKRIQKDNKALFGALLETRKEKTAREKRERKQRAATLPEKTSASTDTEAYYALRSRNRQFIRHRALDVRPSFTQRILVVDDQRRIIEAKEMEKKTRVPPAAVECEAKAQSRVPEAEVKPASKYSLVAPAAEVKPASKYSPLPPPILINQMLTFPYFDAGKVEEDMQSSEANRIISISPNEDKSKLHIPSVTRILNKTMSEVSRLNLELWKQRMITELGIDGFEKYSKELLLNGKQFHSSIQNYLTKMPFEVPSTVENSWQSVQHVLKNIEEVKGIETHAVHQTLRYRGIVDCVAVYRGNLCVIDWKKSDKPKPRLSDTFDAPIQVASYIGALNSDANYKFQVRSGLVVVGYTNGSPATVHEINPNLMTRYWKLWLRRLQQYYWELTRPQKDSNSGKANGSLK